MLELSDTDSLADLRTFTSRASVAFGGATRLTTSNKVLTAWVCGLQAAALGEGTPTVLGMRALQLAHSSSLDAVLDLEQLANYLHNSQGTALDLPGTVPYAPPAQASWTAITPPQGGWELVTELAADRLIEIAQNSMREVAEQLPSNPGTAVVQKIRTAVYARPIDLPETQLPQGMAFTGYSLGFFPPGATVRVLRQGQWLRLSSPAGQTLARHPAQLSRHISSAAN